jgi:putative ABC transport system permease protein
VTTATSVIQDAALAFGEREGVNAVDPAAIGEVFDFDWATGSRETLSQLGADGAVVDEGWAAEHGLEVGSRFEVTSPAGTELALTVRGIERSPVLDVLAFGPITISRAAYEAGRFPTERNRMTFVAASDRATVERAVAPFEEAEAQTTGEYIDSQAATVDAVFGVLGVLLALCVLVSLFGIVNALVLATFERTRELGTLRALGMSRRQMRRMVRHESVITALLGAAGGMAVGLVLAAAITSAFAAEGLAFVVPVPALIAFTVVACLAGVLAAALPARRAARLDPLSALAYE